MVSFLICLWGAVAVSARARSSLLAALIRARALAVRRPYCICRNFYYYYYFSSDKVMAFLPPLTCPKSHQILHPSQAWRKILYLMVCINGRGKMAQQRPLENFVPQAPRYGLTYMHENRYTPVSWDNLKKSLLGSCPKPNRKSAILN